MASTISKAAAQVAPKIVPKVGVVIAAGRCEKTVKVRVPKTIRDGHIRKFLTRHKNFLAHDENSTCVEGDIVEIYPGRTSSTKRHVVTGIVSAMATPSIRPPPETYEQYLARRKSEYEEKRIRKLHGLNAERYFDKYEKDLPELVKELREKKRLEKLALAEEEKKAAEEVKNKKKSKEEERLRREKEGKGKKKDGNEQGSGGTRAGPRAGPVEGPIS